MVYQGALGRCLKFGRRTWPIFPSLTSTRQTTACPTRRSASRLAPSASSRVTELQLLHWTALMSSLAAMPLVWASFAAWLRLPIRGFSPKMLRRCRWDRCSAGGFPWRLENCERGGESAAAGGRTAPRLWTYTRPRWTDDLMTTLARPDLPKDPESSDSPGDDLTLMTDLSRTHSSEISCFVDVASSICKNTHPEVRDMGMERTYKQSSRGFARTKGADGVSKDCTKCIQLGFLCLIIISNNGVKRVTASSSFLYFHPLFYFLFSRGDLRYCLYVKDSFFYNLYKVLTTCWKCPIMFLLLDKNGSILE